MVDQAMGELRILMLEDVPSDAELVESELRDAGLAFISQRVDSRAAFERALDEFKPGIILADYRLPGYNGRDALEYTRRTHPQVPVILVTGALGDEATVELLKLGAKDYVLKGNLARLAPAVKRALSEERGVRNRKLAEGKYRTLFTEARDGIVLVDCETGNILDCNPEFERQTGRALAQLQSLKIWELRPPEKREAAQNKFLEIRETGSGGSSELELQRPDGGMVPVDFVSEVIRTQGMCFIQSISRDVTERLRAERELRESEKRYRRLFEAAHDGILILDAGTGEIVDANPFILDLLSYRLSECAGKMLWEIGLFADTVASKQAFKELQERGYIRYEDMPLETKDGRHIDVEFVSNSYTVDEQKVIQCNIRDITERKQAKILLQQERDFSDGLVETAQVIILVLSPQGRIIRFNRYLENLAGYSLNEVEGRDWFDTFIPESGREQTRKVFMGAIQGFQTRGNVDALLTKDGRQRLIEWYDKTLKDAAGKVTGLISIGLDVTEREQAESRLRASEEKHRLLFESSRDALMTISPPSWTFTGANAATLKLFGAASAAEFSALGPQDVSPARQPDGRDSAEKSQETIAIALREGAHFFEWQHQRIDGTPFPADVLLTRMKVGEDVFLQATVRDITERKLTERALHRANRALRTLSASNLALVHATNENELLRAVTSVIVDKGGYGMAVVCYAEDNPEQSITPKAWSGIEDGYYAEMHLGWAGTEPDQLPITKAIRSGTMQLSHDIISDPVFEPWRDGLLAHGYKANIALPLSASGRTFGGLSIYSLEADAFDDEEVNLLMEMANDLAYGIATLRTRAEHEQHATILRHSLEQSIQTIAGTVEARDPYTAGHQRRVGELATAIAREMELPEDQINGLHLAAIIHDLGKIHIPAEILSKSGKLTDIEYMLIKTHPQAGYDILKDVKFPWPIAEIILQHHERLDGSGYPQGLKEGHILPEAKILAVADVVEAMSSHRPYRPGLGIEAALEEIERHREAQFDPKAVDACVKLFRERGYKLAAQPDSPF